MRLFALRGAISVELNNAQDILDATSELMRQIMDRNALEPHNVVSDTGSFRSGAVDTDETYSFKLDKPGTYPYHCALHPRMVATIIVQ